MIFPNDLPITYLITEGKLSQENFNSNLNQILKLTEFAVDANISLIQIREKNLPAKLILQLTEKVVKISKSSNTKILVNDRADIAQTANADGVHLTSRSISTKVIRQNFPSKFIIGVSTHSLEKAKQAKSEGADFVTFSPVFYTDSKAIYGKPQGLKKLNEVCKKLNPFPIIALGGINKNNFQDAIENGAKGFASISFLNNFENLRKLSL